MIRPAVRSRRSRGRRGGRAAQRAGLVRAVELQHRGAGAILELGGPATGTASPPVNITRSELKIVPDGGDSEQHEELRVDTAAAR